MLTSFVNIIGEETEAPKEVSSLEAFADPLPEPGVGAARNVILKVSSQDQGSAALRTRMTAGAKGLMKMPLQSRPVTTEDFVQNLSIQWGKQVSQ